MIIFMHYVLTQPIIGKVTQLKSYNIGVPLMVRFYINTVVKRIEC